MSTKADATIEDLYRVPDHRKAELVNGEVVLMSPTGAAPNFAGGEIFASLRDFARRTKSGRAVTDSAGFRVNLPHRESLSPDAAFYVGQTSGMTFFEGAPVFAAEVRGENDYGPQVVWDVDLLSADTVKVYRVSDPDKPTIYRRGEIAEAKPAVSGWKMPVDDLFE